jgi:hypothetical protein
MALLIPSLTGSTNEVNQTVNRLGQESTLFTQLRPQPQYNPIAMGVVQPTLLTKFDNTVGSFSPAVLPEAKLYKFAIASASNAGGSFSGQQQPPR